MADRMTMVEVVARAIDPQSFWTAQEWEAGYLTHSAKARQKHGQFMADTVMIGRRERAMESAKAALRALAEAPISDATIDQIDSVNDSPSEIFSIICRAAAEES